MIKCPNCGSENLLGAIFCRQCSEKLDIDNLKPDNIESAPQKIAKNTTKMIRNALALLFTLVLVALAAGLLIPPMKPNQAAAGDSEALLSKYAQFMKGGPKLEVSPEEASVVIQRGVGLDQETIEKRKVEETEQNVKHTLDPNNIWLKPHGDGRVSVILQTKLFGAVPVYLTAKGTPASDPDNKGEFIFQEPSYAIGWIPTLIGPLNDIAKNAIVAVIDESPYNKDGKLKKALKGASYTVTDSKLTISRGKPGGGN